MGSVGPGLLYVCICACARVFVILTSLSLSPLFGRPEGGWHRGVARLCSSFKRAQAQQAFRALDLDGTGYLSLDEVSLSLFFSLTISPSLHPSSSIPLPPGFLFLP